MILNTTDYETEVYRQLNDHEFYKRIPLDPTRHVSRLIKIVVEDVLIWGLIPESLVGFLMNEQP